MAFIPGTKHGTREVFEEKVMLAGCEMVGSYKYFLNANGGDEDAAEAACMTVHLGKTVDIDGDYTETLARIAGNKTAIGVFGLAFYLNNTNTLQTATINGVEGTQETIATGEYPVSRPLYFYIKDAHIGIIPGLKEYAEFFMMDDIAGPFGPLAAYGLVSDPELAKTQQVLADK
jgi:phosphate transport system substrate-binding protein